MRQYGILPQQIDELTITEIAVMLEWLRLENEEQRQEQNKHDVMVDPQLRQVLDASAKEKEDEAFARARAYAKLSTPEKLAVRMRTLGY